MHQEFNFGGYKEDQISIQQVIDATDVDFGPLLDYDGITARERTTGEKYQQVIESVEQIRV